MTRKITLFGSAALVALASSQAVMAGGVAPNTPIQNSIDLSYTSGGQTINAPNAASDTFNVDEKIDFTLVPDDSPTTVSVSPNQANKTLTFVLTNRGNKDRPFDISVDDAPGSSPLGLTLDPTGGGAPGTYSVYISPNATGGPDTLYDPTGISSVGTIAPDGQVYVKIVAQIPDTAVDGQEDNFTVTAHALAASGSSMAAQSSTFTKGTTDIRFGDTGNNNSETGAELYHVLSALVSATKTVTVASENRDGTFICATAADVPGASVFVPGGCINYTITLSNGSGASLDATNFSFSDTLPANVTFSSVFQNNGFDSVTVGSGTVSGTVTSLAPGASADLVIRARVN